MLRIRDIREDSDLTQRAVAADLWCDRSLYSKYERGQRPLPLELGSAGGFQTPYPKGKG